MPGLIAVLLLCSPLGAHADNEPIRLCGHVPITGAQPIPHAKVRFGQFYFDYVNTELGGVRGRPVSFDAYDDGYNPPGARSAMELCARNGTDLSFGFSGVDETISVTKWAEQRHVPYVHIAGARADLHGLTWSADLSPADEDAQGTLADLIMDNPRALTGNNPLVIAMVQYDSPYMHAARVAFADELHRRGHDLDYDWPTQKDTAQFADMYRAFLANHVSVINAHVDSNTFARMLSAQPAGYDPAYVSAIPDLGTNAVAQSAGLTGKSRIVVLHDPSPVYDPNDTTLPWYAEEQEFLRIFSTYSFEQNPPPDEADWMAYLHAKQLHHFLLSLDGDYSPEHIRASFSSFTETALEAFPTCPLDFATSPYFGQRSFHVFELQTDHWIEPAICPAPGAPIDIAPPEVSCAIATVVSDRVICSASDEGSGVGTWNSSSTGIPESATTSGDAGCAHGATLPIPLPPGAHKVDVVVGDCAGHRTTVSVIAVATGTSS